MQGNVDILRALIDNRPIHPGANLQALCRACYFDASEVRRSRRVVCVCVCVCVFVGVVCACVYGMSVPQYLPPPRVCVCTCVSVLGGVITDWRLLYMCGIYVCGMYVYVRVLCCRR